jgi:hypothetical protein
MLTVFQIKLSCELWDKFFNGVDNRNVDKLFNSSPNSHLRTFYSSFPNEKITMKNNKKPWIMSQIKKLCQNKEYLYLLSKSNSDSKLKKYYKSYCKHLTLTIKEAKRNWYNNQILTSNNKNKTIWKIIKTEPNKQNKSEDFIPPPLLFF